MLKICQHEHFLDVHCMHLNVATFTADPAYPCACMESQLVDESAIICRVGVCGNGTSQMYFSKTWDAVVNLNHAKIVDFLSSSRVYQEALLSSIVESYHAFSIMYCWPPSKDMLNESQCYVCVTLQLRMLATNPLCMEHWFGVASSMLRVNGIVAARENQKSCCIVGADCVRVGTYKVFMVIELAL